MRSSGVTQTQSAQQVDLGQKPITNPYILIMRLPDAQHFGPEYGISYAQSRLGHLGIKIDKSFKFEPVLDPVPDEQGVRYVSYLLRAEMTPAQAQAAKKQGFTVERERPVFALET